MVVRETESHKIFLFDLAHGNLDDSQVLSGFVKYYVLNEFTMGNLKDDIVFHTTYGIPGVTTAM